MEAGWMTSIQLCAKLGVKRTTLRRWHVQGRLQARLCNNAGQWLYWAPGRHLATSDTNHPKARVGHSCCERCSMRNTPSGSTSRLVRAAVDPCAGPTSPPVRRCFPCSSSTGSLRAPLRYPHCRSVSSSFRSRADSLLQKQQSRARRSGSAGRV
jgi:hypothetical protein